MPTLTLKGTYMKRNILNIVNFLRGTEPRTDTDIHKPFLEQLRLMKEIDGVRLEIQKAKAETIKWVAGIITAQTVAIIAAIIALMK